MYGRAPVASGCFASSWACRIICSDWRCISAIIRSKPANDGKAIPHGDAASANGRGSTVTFGATLPTYSTRATEPSGSGTFITWVLVAGALGLAAIAVPASAQTAAPARATAGSFLTKTSSISMLNQRTKNYAAILNARLLFRAFDLGHEKARRCDARRAGTGCMIAG